MNRHSILFKLNLLFALVLIATLLAGFLMTLASLKKEQMDLFFKSRIISKELRMSGEISKNLLDELELHIVEGKRKKRILKKAQHHKAYMLRTPFLKQNNIRKINRHIDVLHFQGKRFLHFKRQHNLLFKEKKTLWQRAYLAIMLFVSFVGFLIFMYVLLRRSLLPLKKLKVDIDKYGEGEVLSDVRSQKKDEVSLASNAFYDSVAKTQKLQKSRNLFIRNIFHELNTPVTKGKILVEIVEEEKTKSMLDSIFTKLATLLKELAKIEQITSENYKISLKPIRIQELIDEASDLLYLEEKIETNIASEMMEADFASMSLVFKNLIDNALKYGSKLQILYHAETIIFSSKGKALEHPLAYYMQAFSKTEETSLEKGFGLGLYIVHEILMKHGMYLSYMYEDEKNIFSIKNQNNP